MKRRMLYVASGRMAALRPSVAARGPKALAQVSDSGTTIPQHYCTMYICNTLPTSINTQFTASGLEKVCQLAPGQPVMRNHATFGAADMPVARVFNASVENVGGVDWSALDIHWPQTPAGDEMKALVDSDVWSESSLGWFVNGAKCSICANDLWDAACPHIPGEQYAGKTCLAVMGGEHVDEVDEASFVWKGAAQGTFMVSPNDQEPDEDDARPMPMATAFRLKAEAMAKKPEPVHPLAMLVPAPTGFQQWWGAGT